MNLRPEVNQRLRIITWHLFRMCTEKILDRKHLTHQCQWTEEASNNPKHSRPETPTRGLFECSRKQILPNLLPTEVTSTVNLHHGEFAEWRQCLLNHSRSLGLPGLRARSRNSLGETFCPGAGLRGIDVAPFCSRPETGECCSSTAHPLNCT